MKIHNKKYLKLRRKELRNNATQAEKFLWEELKESKLKGKKFRRQHSVSDYIIDFYCSSEKLAIELDGEIHNENDRIKYDKQRTEYLNSLGVRVIRFENQEVLHDISSVLKEIAQNFNFK